MCTGDTTIFVIFVEYRDGDKFSPFGSNRVVVLEEDEGEPFMLESNMVVDASRSLYTYASGAFSLFSSEPLEFFER